MGTDTGTLKISRILHAGYVLECAQTQIAFDPIFENPFSRNCHAFPNVDFDRPEIQKLKFAAVFISHFHDDHCSLESLSWLDRATPIYMYCLHAELFDWIRELGFKFVYPLQIDQAEQIGSFTVIPRRALDEDVDSIFQIQAAGLKILNVVDSWIDDRTLAQLAAEGPWDMVLWPFQTMRELEVLSPLRAEAATGSLPTEWLDPLQSLNPRFVVPSSCQFTAETWSWYNHAFFPISYRGFQTQVESILPQAQVVRMNPGVSWSLTRKSLKKTAPLPWIFPVGDQDGDYIYEPDRKPPTTAEVSRHFAAVTAAQAERVYRYCEQGLLEKYASLDPGEEIYFTGTRIWRLSVYDHEGTARHFYYRLQAQVVQACPENEGPLAWTTEVPLAKLAAALDDGESLTSMYIRINDVVFSPSIEKEIEGVDIVEDPLIRCLFTGAFGSYQAAQLKRLTGTGSIPEAPR